MQVENRGNMEQARKQEEIKKGANKDKGKNYMKKENTSIENGRKK